MNDSISLSLSEFPCNFPAFYIVHRICWTVRDCKTIIYFIFTRNANNKTSIMPIKWKILHIFIIIESDWNLGVWKMGKLKKKKTKKTRMNEVAHCKICFINPLSGNKYFHFPFGFSILPSTKQIERTRAILIKARSPFT